MAAIAVPAMVVALATLALWLLAVVQVKTLVTSIVLFFLMCMVMKVGFKLAGIR